MAGLNRSTRRRLQKLQQISSVWEGDRRSLSHPLPAGSSALPEFDSENGGDCIIWVDGSQGIVRAMDVISPETGPQAVVRTLLRAMEHPHSPAIPARPQKIVVKDREIQFFLRGVLQELDITIEYVPNLPLIDEIFRGFQEVVDSKPPQLPPQYEDLLQDKAEEVWQVAPWKSLGDHQIIEIEINQWDVGTLYACVMGMLGLDYGILLYRSLESLKQFRQRALEHNSPERLEEAFLSQDCLFVTYESSVDVEEVDLVNLPPSEIQPSFGNLHPLEGMRSILYDEEALVTFVALDALTRFFRSGRRKLAGGNFPPMSHSYQIPLPDVAQTDKKTVSVRVATMPNVADQLYGMTLDSSDDEEVEGDQPLLHEDLVPENCFLGLGVMPWDVLEELHQSVNYCQGATISPQGDGLPMVLIQTSRPKAKSLIQELKNLGGVRGICFNPGVDPLGDLCYDVGIFQTDNGELHLFGEFHGDDPVHRVAREKWNARCENTQGYCGLVIAMGVTGASRGNPKLKDMLALFEVRSLSSEEIGLGLLQLMSVPF